MKILGTQRLLINSRFTKIDNKSYFITLSQVTIFTRHEVIILFYKVFSPQVLAEVETRLQPLCTEVGGKSDGVILIVDCKHIRNLKT